MHIPGGTTVELQKLHHGSNHVQQDPIPPSRYTIQLWCSLRIPLRENLILLKVCHKLTKEAFTASIRSKHFNALFDLFFHFITVSFEYFKWFRFMSYQKDITLPQKVILECNEILVSTSSTDHHGSAYISIYKTQKLWGSLTYSGKRWFSHFTKQTEFTSRTVSQNHWPRGNSLLASCLSYSG